MSRIIKPAPATSEVATDTCWKCDAVVEYTPADVKPDQREGSYVECPSCGAFTAAHLLKWKVKRGGP